MKKSCGQHLELTLRNDRSETNFGLWEEVCQKILCSDFRLKLLILYILEGQSPIIQKSNCSLESSGICQRNLLENQTKNRSAELKGFSYIQPCKQP